MKEYNKLRGGYYAPREISEFITNWAISDTSESVLLREGLGLTESEIKILHDIWDKLRNRVESQ